jgi:subtilisin
MQFHGALAMPRYVVLPAHGFRSDTLAHERLRATGNRLHIAALPGHDPHGAAATVLRGIGADGPRLVETDAEGELALRIAFPGTRILPVLTYDRPRPSPWSDLTEARSASAALAVGVRGVALRVAAVDDGAPVAGVRALAFTNFRRRVGVEATSDASGALPLPLAAGTRVERLYLFPPPGFWGRLERGLDLAPGVLTLRRIDPADPALALARFRKGIDPQAGEGVTVGVIDTGVDGAHPGLDVAGGANMVSDELLEDPGSAGDWGPARTEGEHGSHVAGIVAANGAAGLHGVAPRATLRSYRVFPDAGGGAANFDIAAAIDRAVADGCDIINLSLGGPAPDDVTRAAVGDAVARGAVVVAAAGNDGRGPVSFPAAYDPSVAVAAMGDRDSFPAESTESGDILRPFAEGGRLFVAAFSNTGPQIKLIGPGVGVVSTVPGGGHQAMSGTSMAAPAVAGFAAALLSGSGWVRGLPAPARGQALTRMLFVSAVPVGFGRDYEGFGLPSAAMMAEASHVARQEANGAAVS